MNLFIISKYWHRVKNIELQLTILIGRILSSDLFTHTHSLFLNWKLKTQREIRKKKADTGTSTYGDNHDMNTAENLSSLEQICEVDGESGGRTHPKGHLNITVLKREHFRERKIEVLWESKEARKSVRLREMESDLTTSA